MQADELFPSAMFEAPEDEEQEVTYKIGGVSVILFACPDHLQMTSSGAYRRIWPSSERLAEYLLNEIFTSDSQERVVELGSGAGLCGFALAASKRFSKVLLTDNNDRVLQLLRRNQRRNLGGLVECLSWDDKAQIQMVADTVRPTIVVGADVTYNIEVIPALVATAAALLPSSGKFFLAFSYPRFAHCEDAVLTAAKDRNFNAEIVWDNRDGVRILKLLKL